MARPSAPASVDNRLTEGEAMRVKLGLAACAVVALAAASGMTWERAEAAKDSKLKDANPKDHLIPP